LYALTFRKPVPGQLSKLNFSGVEGESDAILLQCFVPTSEYARVKAGSSVLILGPKGTGKSAILRKLAESDLSPADFVDASPDEFLWERIRSFADETGTSRFSAMHAWQVHVLLSIGLAHFGGNESTNVLPEFLDLAKSAGVVPGPDGRLPVLGNRELNEASRKYLSTIRNRTAQALAVLSQVVEATGSDAAPRTVFLDRIDLYWDRKPAARRATEGLLLAWKELSSAAASLSIKIALRSDAYRLLEFSEHDKIQRNIVELHWTQLELQKLLARRVSYCLHGTSSDALEVLNEVFPTHVSGVRGAGGLQETMPFMLRLIHERPRDLLNLCNLVKQESEADQDAFTAQAIVRAAERFSEEKRIAMEKEYSMQVPKLRLVFQALAGSRDRVTYPILKARLKTAARETSMDFDTLATRLVEIGVLGIQTPRGEEYYTTDSALLSLARSRSTTFVIHRSLRSSLHVVERRERTKPEEIESLHRELVNARHQANELSSKMVGDPIFTPTIRTEAIAANPRVADDLEGFKSFVEDMFQFICESAGQGVSRIPQDIRDRYRVFERVKQIRADFDHDLAHGKEKDIREKQKSLGDYYREYLGKSLPEDEQDWRRLQSLLYGELIDMVQAIVDRLKAPSQPSTSSPAGSGAAQ